MPELPEVESVRRGLEDLATGRRIIGFRATSPSLRWSRHHDYSPEEIHSLLRGVEISAARRRGKFLWLELADTDLVVVIHLGMSGQVRVDETHAPMLRHTHVCMDMDNGASLRFVDQRTFGYIFIQRSVTDPHQLSTYPIPESIRHIGPDICESRDQRAVFQVWNATSRVIKTVLLDQHVLSGIGNIYADESLWLAQIAPTRQASSLTSAEHTRLWDSMSEVMNLAIAQGGTSFDALYVNVNGESGYFDRSLNAYGREDLPCNRCGEPLKKMVLAQRSTHYCHQCQR